jgi:hypothetical protein
MIFAPLHTGFMGLMGALDSVAVAVGTSPPSFSVEPESNTNLSRGDNFILSWTAAAGTGALTKWELFKGGVDDEVSETATASTVFTVGFADFSLRDEGYYVVRVTQANGAYRDSDKVTLRMLHLDSGGNRLDPDGPGIGFDPHWGRFDALAYFMWEDIWAGNQPVTQIDKRAKAAFREHYPGLEAKIGVKEVWVFHFRSTADDWPYGVSPRFWLETASPVDAVPGAVEPEIPDIFVLGG